MVADLPWKEKAYCMIEKIELDQLLPHTGNMSLLSAVTVWDDQAITCTASSHTDVNNPLSSHGQLLAVNAVEYAAQAMAIHRTLLSQRDGGSGKPRVGFLATASKVKFAVQRLDHLAGELEIKAECLTASADGSMYSFTIQHGGDDCVTGQAMVMLAPEASEAEA